MAVYRYEHECGYKHDQFLKVDKDTIILTCERCGQGVSAHQVRDKTAVEAKNNDVVGILRHENN